MFLTDQNILLKAYLRRGLAYEQMEKYLQAKEDMLTVKQMQADNKQASQCLNRCNKAIADLYGDKVPETKKNPPVRLADTATTGTPPKVQENGGAKPKAESTPDPKPAKESSFDREAIDKKLLDIKD